MTRPRLLDLFCGQGGCSMGYHRAGFDVVGVDLNPMPRYPFASIKAGALAYVAEFGGLYDAIHASPPCQAYSAAMKHLTTKGSPKLIDECRSLLAGHGKPWVIENVAGSPLAASSDLFGSHGVLLCGSMFGLRIWRHRLFETSFPIGRPSPCSHDGHPINPHREESRERMRCEFGRVDLEAVWRKEAGVEWMDKKGGRQAIPPVFTEFIGKQLIRILEAS